MQSLKWLNVTRQLRTKSEDDGATTLAKALEDRHIDDSSNRGSCDVSNKRVSSWLEHGTVSQKYIIAILCSGTQMAISSSMNGLIKILSILGSLEDDEEDVEMDRTRCAEPSRLSRMINHA